MTVERITREAEFVLAQDERFTLPDLPTQKMPETAEEAESLGTAARDLIGVDRIGPCTYLDAKVARCGLLTFSLDLGVDSADAATVLIRHGGIAVVNGGSLRVGRRRLALAHEFGHYLVADDYTVDWRVAEYQNAEVRESLLDRFARALLLPAQSIKTDWANYTADSIRTAAVRIASSYRVDMATLARRLVELGLVDHTTAGRVRSIRTTQADIVELDLVVGEELTPPTLPREYERAVLRLFRNESISAARALDLLLDSWTEDMLPELPKRAEEEIWQYI
jgi:Zn-dependent peptidase ImmA (M78 family)